MTLQSLFDQLLPKLPSGEIRFQRRPGGEAGRLDLLELDDQQLQEEAGQKNADDSSPRSHHYSDDLNV